MATIEIQVTRTARKKVDVTFPAFFSSDGGCISASFDYGYRLDADGTIWTITRERNHDWGSVEFSIEKRTMEKEELSDWFGPDRDRRHRYSPTSAAYFAGMLAEMRELVSSVPG